MDFRPAIKADRFRMVALLDSFIALGSQRPVVNPGREARAIEGLVLAACPERPPVSHKVIAVPLAGLHAPKPHRRGLAQCQQDVGMMVVRMVAFFEDRRMDGDVCHHATADEGLLDEV